MIEDTSLTCRECKQGFVFTGGEAAFFSEKKFAPPVRCKGCRDSRKAANGASVARPSPAQQEPVVQRVAERYQPTQQREQRRGYDARPQVGEDDQPAKFDRHASKRRKHRHDQDDDDHDGW